MPKLYRAAMAIRRKLSDPGDGTPERVGAGDDPVGFRRGPHVRGAVNLGPFAAIMPTSPEGREVVLPSAPLDADGALTPDPAAWFRCPR